jgi:hypothetical protein
MTRWYNLNDDGKLCPVSCENVHWDKRWHIKTKIGQATVSTVFLAYDHSTCDNEPLLFETFVFGGHLDACVERYSTKEDAIKGHEKWAMKVKESKDKEEFI